MLISDKKRALKKAAQKHIKKHCDFSVAVPWDLVADVEEYAKSIGRTRSVIVRWALREYLQRKRPKPAEEDD